MVNGQFSQHAGPFQRLRSCRQTYRNQQLTRSELGGYTAPLLLVTLLARHWGLKHKCKFTWVVDSTAAIAQVTFATNPAHANQKYPDNVDYLSTIKALHKELKRPIRAKWVKAHQDDNKKHEHLSRYAILNIEADRLATQHRLQHHIRPKHKTEHLHSTKISVGINGTRYHSNIPSNKNFHINGTYMKKYLQDKHNWTDKTWQEIDMEGFGAFHKSLTPSQRIRHSKFVHNLQPTGKRLLQQARIPDIEIATCPCCRTSTEDQIHLYTCNRQLKSRICTTHSCFHTAIKRPSSRDLFCIMMHSPMDHITTHQTK